MDIIPLLAKEMEQEALATRKMLRLVPAENFNWKPHEKSMSQQNLAVHISELPGWVAMGFATSELDFATMDYKPTVVNSNAELLQLFEDSFAKGMAALKNAKEEDLWNTWTIILNFDNDMLIFGRRFQFDFAFAVHGIDRVVDDIRPYLV